MNVKSTMRAGLYEFEFVDEGITITMKNIHSEKGQVIARMYVKADPSKHVNLTGSFLDQMTLNMNSNSGVNSKVTAIKTFSEMIEDVPWDAIVNYCAINTTMKFEEGHPLVMIGNLPPREEVPYMLHPLIRKDVPCILYGESGIGKSYVALFLALLITNEIPAVGLTPRKANVLYLDWEDGEQNMDERLKALAKGLDIETPQLHYQYMDGNLKERLDMVAERISNNDIDLIIVDSKGASLGGRINEADTTVQLFNAIRSLRVTSIVIDHVAKQSAIGPIGSTYTVAEARNVWEMTSTKTLGDNNLRIGFYHRKTNMGKIHDSFALEFIFNEDGRGVVDKVSVQSADVGEDDKTRASLYLWQRIQKFLELQAMPDGTFISTPVEEIRLGCPDKQGKFPDIDTVTARLSDKKYNGQEGFWERSNTGEYRFLPVGASRLNSPIINKETW